MGRLNLLGGQSNLLGGHLPNQLTCYLPLCLCIMGWVLYQLYHAHLIELLFTVLPNCFIKHSILNGFELEVHLYNTHEVISATWCNNEYI